MDCIRIDHRREGHLWAFTSPDLPGLIGGRRFRWTARRAAEGAAYLTIECDAEDAGRSAPARSAVRFVHRYAR